MKWIQGFGLYEKLRRSYYTVTIVLAVVCLAALFTETNPGAGFYGALIVLLFTSIAAIEHVKDKPPNQRILPVITWVGFLVGAYLLLADASGVHVTDWSLLATVILLWLAAGVLVVAMLPFVLVVRSEAQKNS